MQTLCLTVLSEELKGGKLTIEQALCILKRDESLPKQCVVRSLPDLLLQDYSTCLDRVVPLLLQLLERPDLYLHTEAAAAFIKILQGGAISPENFVSVFLPRVLDFMTNDDLGMGVYGKWLEVALELLHLLPAADVLQPIYHVAQKYSQMEAMEYQRVGAAALLGRLAQSMEPHKMSGDVWPLLQAMSQDESSDVRAVVCEQLTGVFAVAGADLTNRELLPCLIELSRDEEVTVRAQAVTAVIQLLPTVSADVLKAGLLPLVQSICNRASDDVDEAAEKLSQHFGALCIALKARDVLKDFAKCLVDLFANLGTYNQVTMAHDAVSDSQYRILENTRINCACCLPDVLEACPTSRVLCNMCSVFTVDPSFNVRAAIAEKIHLVIANTVNKDGLHAIQMRPLKRALLDLLRDSNENVLQGTISHLTESVQLLTAYSVLPKTSKTQVAEVVTAMLNAGDILQCSNNWRLQRDLCTQLSCAIYICTSNYIFKHLYPFVYQNMISSKAWPIRQAAGETVLTYLRYNLSPVQRTAIRTQLRDELCASTSCHRRMLFVKLCAAAVQMFSLKYFIKFFLNDLLSLHDDKVVNVRLFLAQQLSGLFMRTESDDVTHVHATMLLRETDADVIHVLRAQEQLMERSMKHPQDKTGAAKEDQARFDEEKRLAALSGGEIAKQPKILPTRNRSESRGRTGFSQTVPASQLVNSTSYSRAAATFSSPSACTCKSRSGAAMEMSWLNLESALRRELGGLRRSHSASARNRLATNFSSVFEKEFYRDAGVLPDHILYHAPITTPTQPSSSYKKSLPEFYSETKKLSTDLIETRNSFYKNLSRQKSADLNVVKNEHFDVKLRGVTLPAMQPKFLAESRRSKSFVLPTTRLSVAVKPESAVSVITKTSVVAQPESTRFKMTRIPVSNRRSMDISHWSGRSGSDQTPVAASRLPIRKKP